LRARVGEFASGRAAASRGRAGCTGTCRASRSPAASLSGRRIERAAGRRKQPTARNSVRPNRMATRDACCWLIVAKLKLLSICLPAYLALASPFGQACGWKNKASLRSLRGGRPRGRLIMAGLFTFLVLLVRVAARVGSLAGTAAANWPRPAALPGGRSSCSHGSRQRANGGQIKMLRVAPSGLTRLAEAANARATCAARCRRAADLA